jgi:excisionase family DNA binding protein
MSSSDPSLEPSSALQPMLVSTAEAARLLGVHRATVYDLINSGALPSVKIGRRRMISVYSLKAFIGASENRRL